MKSVAQPCSDHRLVLARRGALSASEWQDFAAHLSTCADCRIAWRFSADFAGSAGAVPGDERIIARAAKAALGATALGATTMPRVRRIRLAFATAAMLVAASVASGAVALRSRYFASFGRSAEPAPGSRAVYKAISPSEAKGPAQEFAEPAQPLMAESTAVEPPPQPTHSLAKDKKPRRLASVSLSADLEPPPATPSQTPGLDGAHVVFAQAVRARQEGRFQDAIASFRTLQAQFPDTPPALVSLVSLGDLSLRVGSPSEALASFESYVRRVPSGALVPEALAGEARALKALGRAQESEQTWRDLARRFPGSPYARGAAVEKASP
jgi:TolA-binding protein